ncbi:DUF6215 domain-containing protein [Streptomyces sp. NPDC001795]|uniref:DUF6215 domain-containing protein n=1 Tax=unclassified Streptomyces TaxID=2593676 RepID=UPI00331F1DBA
MFLLRLLPPLPREISLAVVGLLFGLFLAVQGAFQAYAEATGVPGTVTITECTPATGGLSDLWQDGWACEGSFAATDHSVNISSVAVDGVIETRPADGTLPALVDGSGDHTATRNGSGSWKIPTLTGVVILAFTAWRIRTVRAMLRRRRVVRAADSGGLTPGPVNEGSSAGREMTSEQDKPHYVAPAKEPNAWGQAVAAVAVVGALGVALWMGGETSSSNSAPSPARCSGGEPEKAPRDSGKAPRHVSGAQLCKALNRPDLAELLGTPGETVKTADGSGGSLKLAGGKEIDTPSAQVEFRTYNVTLSATYDRLPVATSAALLGDDARPRTVLGRPAVFYSDRTISIRFRLDGSDATSGPGVPARVLTVAQDKKDSGGSFEVTLWRTDGGVPDDAVLLRVAEKVLPTVPGWAAPYSADRAG